MPRAISILRRPRVARRLGQRAILLTGDRATVASDGDLFACAYAPHSHLFHRCCVIVHHGGIGTTGQALRAGKPQLVVPHMGDQNDNGHRIARAGIGRVLKAKLFSARRATPMLEDLLRDPARRERAARIGEAIALENGAQAAARASRTGAGARAGARWQVSPPRYRDAGLIPGIRSPAKRDAGRWAQQPSYFVVQRPTRIRGRFIDGIPLRPDRHRQRPRRSDAGAAAGPLGQADPDPGTRRLSAARGG